MPLFLENDLKIKIINVLDIISDKRFFGLDKFFGLKIPILL